MNKLQLILTIIQGKDETPLGVEKRSFGISRCNVFGWQARKRL